MTHVFVKKRLSGNFDGPEVPVARMLFFGNFAVGTGALTSVFFQPIT